MFGDGLDALAAIRNELPALIVLDLMLPDAQPPQAPLPPAPPPAPPAPPPLPEIPAAAHAACAGKANGSKLSFTPGPGETMSGLCERVDGRMVFQLRSYRSVH